jgi:ABC-type multidrug transport system fused ATPase/permease subunit
MVPSFLPNTLAMNPPKIETNPPVSSLGSSLLVRANEGRTLRAFGHAIMVLLDGKQTDGKCTAFLNISPPGCGPGPHYHEREDEWFYIVEGRDLEMGRKVLGRGTRRRTRKRISRMTSHAVELRGVQKSFGNTSVIRDVNLTVVKGERHALIGPNGAGKTTLFNLISGYMKPTAGRILIRKRLRIP